MKKMPWVKLAAGFLRDEKVHFIIKKYGHDTMVVWTGLLTECERGVLEMDEEIFAEVCIMDLQRFDEIKKALIESGLITINHAGRISVTLWGRGRRSGNYTTKPKRTAISSWLRSFVFGRDGFICSYCKEQTDKPEVDHIIPVSRGGTNDLQNLATACFACNRSKQDKLLQEWQP